MSYRWWSSCRTTPGMRRSVNEDAYLDLDAIGLWAVADGMGGHARGDVASRLVIDSLRDTPKPRSMGEFVLDVRRRLNQVNRLLLDEATRAGDAVVMGSTVVAFLVWKREWHCLWAGDSRAYLLRDGKLAQITHDHSITQELIDRGQLSAADAPTHPAANRITRAVGAQAYLGLEEAHSVLRDGDAILLCSDGLTKELSDRELAGVLEHYDCEEASRELLDLTLERGARDNVTVAVIRFEAITGYGERKPDDTAVNYGLATDARQTAAEPRASIHAAVSGRATDRV